MPVFNVQGFMRTSEVGEDLDVLTDCVADVLAGSTLVSGFSFDVSLTTGELGIELVLLDVSAWDAMEHFQVELQSAFSKAGFTAPRVRRWVIS